jgi:hypothetical protein
MKSLRSTFVALAFVPALLSATPIAHNYLIYNVDAGVTGLESNWFGDNTLAADAFFFHTASGPMQATLGTGLLRVGSTINIDPDVLPLAFSYNFAPSAKTIQTTAAAANGFQVSSTRKSWVTYSVTITTATTVLGTSNSSGYVVLEIAATNSTTASDWKEVGRMSSGQNTAITVAVGTITQTGGGSLSGMVPSGYYTRLRSVSVADTPTFAYNSGQEVLM